MWQLRRQSRPKHQTSQWTGNLWLKKARKKKSVQWRGFVNVISCANRASSSTDGGRDSDYLHFFKHLISALPVFLRDGGLLLLFFFFALICVFFFILLFFCRHTLLRAAASHRGMTTFFFPSGRGGFILCDGPRRKSHKSDDVARTWEQQNQQMINFFLLFLHSEFKEEKKIEHYKP